MVRELAGGGGIFTPPPPHTHTRRVRLETPALRGLRGLAWDYHFRLIPACIDEWTDLKTVQLLYCSHKFNAI